MDPPNPAPKALETIFKLKSACAKGMEENFCFKQWKGRRGGGPGAGSSSSYGCQPFEYIPAPPPPYVCRLRTRCLAPTPHAPVDGMMTSPEAWGVRRVVHKGDVALRVPLCCAVLCGGRPTRVGCAMRQKWDKGLDLRCRTAALVRKIDLERRRTVAPFPAIAANKTIWGGWYTDLCNMILKSGFHGHF